MGSDGFQPVEQGGQSSGALRRSRVTRWLVWLSVLGKFCCPSLCNDRCQGRVQAERPSSCVSQRWLLKEFPASLVRAVHTWKHGAFPPGHVFWCCLWNTET